MERRKFMTGAVGGLGSIALAATYAKADRVPVLEQRLSDYERRLAILEGGREFFHGERTHEEIAAAAEKARLAAKKAAGQGVE